jgi:hypothetical protein
LTISATGTYCPVFFGNLLRPLREPDGGLAPTMAIKVGATARPHLFAFAHHGFSRLHHSYASREQKQYDKRCTALFPKPAFALVRKQPVRLVVGLFNAARPAGNKT